MTTLDLELLHDPTIRRESTIIGIPALREPAILALPDLDIQDRGHLLESMCTLAEAVTDGEARELALLAGSPAHVRELAGIVVDQRSVIADWELAHAELAAELAQARQALGALSDELAIQRGIASAARKQADACHVAKVHADARASLLVQFGNLCMELSAQDSEVRRMRQELAARDVLVARFDSAARAITGKSADELAQEIAVPPADDDEFGGDTQEIPIARSRVATDPAMPAARRRFVRVIDARCTEVRS